MGFLSTSTNLAICNLEDGKRPDGDILRTHAFDPESTETVSNSGWVGLGDLLDTDNFFQTLCDGRFSGCSLRIDQKKPSSALVKLRTEDAIRKKETGGIQLSREQKRELREAVAAKVLSETPFIPSIIDCIHDAEKSRLYLSATSENAILVVRDTWNRCFGGDPLDLIPEVDMQSVFASLASQSLNIAGWDVSASGSGSLKSTDTSRKAISVQNGDEFITMALSGNMTITKLGLILTKEGSNEEIVFTLDEKLAVSGLKLPKADNDCDPDASFLINADIIATVADVVEGLAKG